MMRRIFLSLFSLSALLLLGAGCTLKFGGASEGGMWKTLDSGINWTTKHSVQLADGKQSDMGNEEITTIKINARDGKYVFAGTVANGLYISENAGEVWYNTLPKQSIRDVALDSSSRCVVYALTPKQLYKTTDCAKNWIVAYDETRPSTTLTSTEADPIQSEIVYITTSEGDILKSLDRGTTWTAIYRLPDTSISDLIIDRLDSHLLYIATTKNGVYRSLNKGVSWEDVSGIFKQSFFGPTFRWIGALSHSGGVLFVDQKGMYRSHSMGTTWESIPLLTPEGDALILAVALNPNNDDEIVYATPTTYYRTIDGGAHWISRPLPSTRAGSALLFDPYNPSTMYLGTKIYKAVSPYFQ